MSNRAEGVVDVYINDQQAQNSLKELEREAAGLIDQLDKLEKANDKLGFDQVNKKLTVLNREMNQYKKRTLDVEKVLNNLSGVSYNKLVKAQRQVRKEMRGMSRVSKADNDLWKKKQEQLKKVDNELKKVQKDMKYAGNETSRFGSIAKKAGPMLAAAFSIGAITSFVSGVVRVRKEFETYAAVLTNTLGSKSEAQKSLTMIKDFAAKTPFQVGELTGSFVKLANMGFKPTREEMTKLGDLASSTGKSFGQLSEAILDANTFEFERLKEFGIRASKQGDKVTFTFKGVKTQIDATSDSVQKYLIGLGDVQGVSGSMGAISQTLEGKISNMGDALDSLLNTIGKLAGGVIMSVVGGFADLVGWTEKLISLSVADKMEAERIEVNKLTLELNTVNTSMERRKVIIEQLKDVAPEVVKGIDAEKVSYENLNAQLVTYNDRMLQSILIAEKSDKITKQAGLVNEYQRLANEAKADLMGVMVEWVENDKFGDSTEKAKQILNDSNKSIEDRAFLLEDLAVKERIWNAYKISNTNSSYQAYHQSYIKEKGIYNDLQNDIEETKVKYEELFKVKYSESGQTTNTTKIKEPDPPKKTVHRNKQGQTFEEWKAAQIEFSQQEQEYWDEVSQTIEVPEEDIEPEEADYLTAKYKETLDARLAFLDAYHQAGLISEAEYNDKLVSLQAERAAKEQVIQDMSNKQKLGVVAATAGTMKTIFDEGTVAYRVMASGEALINTYLAATAALTPPPVGAGPIWGVPIAGATVLAGLANVAKINSVQFASGKYDVIGATDGKTYRAGYSPAAQTGIYSEPTLLGGLGLVGERAPELVVDGPSLSNIQMNAPQIIEAIHAMRVPQYATGNYPGQPPSQTAKPETVQHEGLSLIMIELLGQISEKLDKPTRAAITYTDIEDTQNEINDIINSVSI